MKANRRIADIRRREQIEEIVGCILLVPMLYILTVLVFCL